MKNNLFKKSMSVFLSILMILSCWVFVPGEHNHAEAANLPDNTLVYPVTITFNVTDDLANGGHILVNYYKINDDGTVDMSTSHQYIFINSLKTEGYSAVKNGYTKTANIPGWPHSVTINVAKNDWDTDKLALKTITIGNRTVFNDSWTVQDNQEVTFAYNNSQGSWSGSTAWFTPSWAVSSYLSGATLQVPSCGSRTSGSLSAAFYDSNYNVAWPQDYVRYSINGSGVTLSSTTGSSTTVSVTNAALANFTDASGTANLTLKATGAGKETSSTITLIAPMKDVTFENLFSLSDWRYSDSYTYNSNNGEITVENNDSTIRIYKNVTGELTTGSSYPNKHSENMYAMPVDEGKDYTVSFNTTSSAGGGTIAPEIFLFWYDVNNYYLGLNNQKFDGNGDHSVTFTAPENAAKAEIRFDNDCSTSASTLRFNNIAVYPADRAAEIDLESWGNRPYTKAYTYKAALGAEFLVPTRLGYVFNGWYLDNNNSGTNDDGDTAVTDGNGTVINGLASFGIDNHYNLYADWVPVDYTLNFDANGGTATEGSISYDITGTVTMPNATRDSYVFDFWKVITAGGNWVEDDTYNFNQQVSGKYGDTTLQAQWTKLHTVTFLDGDDSVLSIVEVKNGEAAPAPVKTPTKAKDENYSYDFSSWDTDFLNVTADITVKPVFTPKAHTVEYGFISDPTCEKNAIVDKYCATCGYEFFSEKEYDGTEIEEYLALGHNFDGQPAVTGSSSNGTHEVRCIRYTSESCGGTTRVEHSFNTIVSTEGADCVTPGIVTKKCACGETTQEAGSTAPNVHNNTRLINVKAPTCLEDGYTGDTYCDNCNQTVATGEVDPRLGHSFTNYVYNDDAKCEVDGSETAKCDRCDVTDTRTKTGSALEHKYTNYVYNNDAECEVNGTKTASCDNGCGKTNTIEAEGTALEHDYTGEIQNNGNGTHSYLCKNNCGNYGGTVDCSDWAADGNTCKCEDCGYTKAHEWGEWTKNSDNTALAAGKMTRTCNDCGATETTDCTYEETAHSDATCTAPERTTYTCTECGHGYTAIGEAATGHDFSGEYKYDSSADTHQQLCANGCGTYGVGTTANAKEPCSWTYANKEEGKHTATCVCGNSEEQNCSGGTATCTDKAECQFCGEAYGTTADHSFNGKAVKLDGDVHAYLCEYCGDTTGIYGVGNTVNATEACSGGTATCSALAVCDVCEDTHGELDADNHKWGEAVADADNAGKHIYTCEYNDEHKKSEACVSGSSEVVAPTCTDQGYTIQTCKDCSYEWKTDYTDATNHNWVDPVCNNDGTHTLTCNNENADGWKCDETLTLNCAESAITFGLEPATCTEQGYTKYQCTVCNYTWNADFVPATGHSYTKKLRDLDASYKRSDKTCTEAETYWYRCDNCTVSAGTEADKYADDLASIYWTNGKPSGHDMQRLVDETDLAKNRKSEATCTSPAVYYYSCSVCGEKDETQTFTYKAALGHDYQNIVDENNPEKNRVSEATCTSAAIYNKSCSRCGDVSNETFEHGDKIGHKMTKTEAVKETCTTPGNVEYYTCSNCGKKFKDEDGKEEISKVELPALGHDLESVAFKAASCEEDGHSAYKECSRCDYITGKTIYKATGHKFTGAYTFDSAIGYHSRYCVNDNCLADGEKAKGMVDAEGNNIKLNITFVDDEAVVVGGEKCEFTSSETDTDENGIHSHKLSCVCGNVTSKAYSDAETFVETVAPTCTEDGYDAHECPDCDATWQKNIVEAEGHKLADKATSNGDGTHSVKCTACDYEADAEKCSGGTATCKDKAVCEKCGAEYGETTDHSYDDTKWVYQNNATCTDDGTEKNSCTVCGEETTRTAEDTATGHSVIADYVYDISAWKHKPADFDEEIKAPTCGAEGLGIMYCENCDYYRTKSVGKNEDAHEWSEPVTSGDCASGVVEISTCTICGKKKTETIGTVEHTWVEIVRVEADCEHDGYSHFKCSVCGFVQVFNAAYEGYPVFEGKDTGHTKALGHTWEREGASEECDIIDKAPTCGLDGRGYHVCAVCKEKSDAVVIEKTGHVWDKDGDGFTDEGFAPELNEYGYNKDYVYVEAEEATCVNFGHDGYYKCSDCSYDQHLDERWISHYSAAYPMKDHQDKNEDGKCDTCNGAIHQGGNVEEDDNKGCDCICHKESWFMKLIYKILRFFWKLFKISKTCACGAAHY